MSENEPAPTTGGHIPSMLDALVPCIALIVFLALSYYLFGDAASSGPNQIALAVCGLIAAGVAYKNGSSWAAVRAAVVDGIATGLPAILILMAVGALIGTWALSGTIMSMVYYGLKLLNPDYFYATTTIVCAVVAFSIGSSWTVAGTIGIGLMGVAAHMDLSPAITAGAVISGAYFGDKASPLSDTVNLAAASAGSEIFDHIRESLWTSIPALLLSIVLFGFLGEQNDFDASSLLTKIDSQIQVSLWAFLPLLLVFVLSVARVSPVVAIFSGALAGAIQGVIMDPQRVIAFANDAALPSALALLKGAWLALATGYTSSVGDPDIDMILSRGGMASMMTTIWLIITALAFGAVIEHAGILNRLIDPLIHRAKSDASLISTVAGTAVLSNVVTSDQYISIALPGRMFKQAFANRGLAPALLSRVIGDSATVTSPLIPWNSCGAYMAAALGVSTTAYLGFCFFNILNPLMTIGFSLLGWRVLRTAPAKATS
ncbi:MULTISPECIES: Na+/H+ antiporter NhaC family protein [Brucella/Ochrobactrum group]|uniref:Na+/H+ antiporter NhaC family protein n=1 Tax=Ochrobactrum teleogrylli TaxID=2479765 RepID=A0ABD5JU93_9HYPH|nr:MULTISPECIES: Na+/H+ antiporter NhaC family protein [Brucella]WHS33335.1 Na+/H+ antiporter NhaC family protein [Brucella sp. NM4]WHT43437.1 Na+/H+ antiporter NhaC family protein [Ochrobactrum sp. SSR]